MQSVACTYKSPARLSSCTWQITCNVYGKRTFPYQSAATCLPRNYAGKSPEVFLWKINTRKPRRLTNVGRGSIVIIIIIRTITITTTINPLAHVVCNENNFPESRGAPLAPSDGRPVKAVVFGRYTSPQNRMPVFGCSTLRPWFTNTVGSVDMDRETPSMASRWPGGPAYRLKLNEQSKTFTGHNSLTTRKPGPCCWFYSCLLFFRCPNWLLMPTRFPVSRLSAVLFVEGRKRAG